MKFFSTTLLSAIVISGGIVLNSVNQVPNTAYGDVNTYQVTTDKVDYESPELVGGIDLKVYE